MTAYSATTKRTPAAFFTLLSAACLLALQAGGTGILKPVLMPLAAPAGYVTVEGVEADAFDPRLWQTGTPNPVPDFRFPLLEPLAGACRNIYAPSAVETPIGYRVFYGAWDGIPTGNDRLYSVTADSRFQTFADRHSVVLPGSYIHVCNVNALGFDDGSFALFGTVYPVNSLNKPGFFRSDATGANWNGSSGEPYTVAPADIVSIAGYSANADINGMNAMLLENGSYRLYFGDFNNFTGVNRATSTDGKNYTYEGQVLSGGYCVNDVKTFLCGTTNYYLMGLHRNGDRLWYALSTNGLQFADVKTLLVNQDAADRYIVAHGWVVSGAPSAPGRKLLGVLYGAGAAESLDQNRIFARWFQKRAVFVTESGTRYSGAQALGPDRQLVSLPAGPLRGRFELYAEDGVTLLRTSGSLTISPGQTYRLLVDAMPIPKLFSTGLSDAGTVLGGNVTDPHYTLSASADTGYPGPAAVTVNATGPLVPGGPWLPNNSFSSWIAPRASQDVGNPPGYYNYRTTFDLTDYDPSTATINGSVAADDELMDVRLNGVSMGVAGAWYGAFTEFTLAVGSAGFVSGTNTLDFSLLNYGASGSNPTGLRVELFGAARPLSASPFVDQTALFAPEGIQPCYSAVACGDFNNDGFTDLVTAGGIYRNNGGTNVTRLADSGFGSGVWADYNNDGYLDLYSWEGGSGRLFRNNSGTGFTQVASPSLPGDVTGTNGNQSQGACWGDFNNDGYVDLYVGGYEVWGDDDNNWPCYDAILMNNAAASFSMTTSATNRSRGVSACDFDKDGDIDVYVSNYRLEPNVLWRNNGSGAFTDVAAAYGVDGDGYVEYSGYWGHTIGSSWGDLDNDGNIDLFVGNFSHPYPYQDRPKFMRNMGPSGNYHFELKWELAGANWQESYCSPTLGDYDNDGDLDLFYTTVYDGDTSRLWRNDGNWVFTDVTAAEGFLGVVPSTYAAAWVDLDNDGDLDLVTAGKIFKNQGNSNHWLRVRLEGNGSTVNRAAIGAQVRIDLGGGKILTRQVEGATGKGSQNELTLHFGLGSRTVPVTLAIFWPDGTSQTVTGVAVDQTMRIFTQPNLARSPATLAPACTRGGDAASQSFEVWNAVGSTLNYTITDNAAWLSVTPASGTSLGERKVIQVHYDTDALASGTYSATITITGGGATNSPQTVAVTLTVTPAAADLPIVESFEPYPVGLALAGTNGWSGSANAGVVTALTYAAQTPPGYPLPAAAHTRALKVVDTLERAVNGVAGQSVNADFMMQALRRDPLPADLSGTEQAAFCVDSNGFLNVWHLHHDGLTWPRRWTSLGGSPIAEDQWVRVSVTLDYSSSPSGDTFFCPRINGSLCPTAYGYKAPGNLTSPGPWYMCADSPGRGGGGSDVFSRIALEGHGCIDDVTITTSGFAHTGSSMTNGVPFSWFDRWGVARAPDADYDADGLSAAAEYAAGTDPSDTGSSFRVVSSWVEGGLFYIQFLGNDSGDSRPFLMEGATNGLACGWSVADAAIPRVSAPQTTNTWWAPLLPTGPVFYRPRALPVP